MSASQRWVSITTTQNELLKAIGGRLGQNTLYKIVNQQRNDFDLAVLGRDLGISKF